MHTHSPTTLRTILLTAISILIALPVQAVDLVTKGKPVADIVISADAIKATRTAAEEHPGVRGHARHGNEAGSSGRRRGCATVRLRVEVEGHHTNGPAEPVLLTVGEVRMVEEETNPYVIR